MFGVQSITDTLNDIDSITTCLPGVALQADRHGPLGTPFTAQCRCSERLLSNRPRDNVERRSMAIHSQLLDCTASEVAAMVEGAMHHGTTMAVEGNYVDASTEAILRRFTRAATHPTYQAMLEVGRAQKTIFVARYLRDRDLQREVGEGLNVLESHNRGQSIILYGKGGELATNRRDERELTVACLRVLQAALVYVNTLMLQDILADRAWEQTLTAEDRRGLTPLFWSHVAPYGEVRLDMRSRLSLRATPYPGDQQPPR